MSMRERFLVYATAAWFAVMVAVHALVFEPMADGQKAPDSRFGGYTFDDLAGWAGALDPAERLSFLRWHTGFLDFIFPVLLMAALFTLMLAALRQFERFRRQPSWIRAMVPLVLIAPYGLFDYLENGLVADMLRGVTPVNEVSAGLAATYTVLKFGAVAIAFSVTAVFWFVARRQKPV